MMIRINLIAEKKTGTAKAGPKKTAGTGKKSELEENMILLICVVLALGAAFWLNHRVKTEMSNVIAENKKLKAEYEKVKIWKDKKEQYEIQKELLNEKIQKISELKDKKVGPVKLMEDISNVLPESVWLVGIAQGYDRKLTQRSSSVKDAYKPDGRNMGDKNLIRVSGYAKTTDSITNFAKKIRSLSGRYEETDLNTYTRVEQGYEFNLFFKIKPNGGDTADDAKGSGS